MARIMIALLTVSFAVSFGIAQDDAATYLLRYKLKKGEQIHYEVTHVAKTKTRVQGTEGISQVHTISKRHWDVTEQQPNQVTFAHVIDEVQMTQQKDDEDEIRWSSNSKDDVPRMFRKVADQMGKELSTLTINLTGQVINRKSSGGTEATLGMGPITLALPEKAVKIGDRWSVPREVKTRTEDGLVKPIKIREVYKLVKVETGVATLSVKSEPLTPMDQESVRAQVVQQLSNGTIRFDIDNGRMLSKQLDWDETVVGFSGPNTLMEYRSRMTEKIVDDVKRTAKKQ